MSDKELITTTMEEFSRLQHIKKANGDHKNEELDYYIRVTTAKLSALGVSVEDLKL